MLQDYHNQIEEANAVSSNFEQLRQQHQDSANHWDSQINTWGVVGYRNRRKSREPIYGWIYSPEAEASRDAELAAANSAAQQRDLATQQAQQLTTALQPQIEATETNIAQLQTDKQNLELEKQNLEAQLGNQQQELQNLQSELGEIEQNIGSIESDIATK